MTKEDFELLGFTTETLPSGYLNIINKVPFCYNGGTTVITYRGGTYIRTTTHKTLETFFRDLTELRTLDPSSLKSSTAAKKKTKKVQETHLDALEPVTDQSLAEFLTASPESPTKTRRKRKT
jgi:hypothetical protein